MKNTKNVKQWVITTENIEEATAKITWSVVKNRLKSGHPLWLEVRQELPKALRRCFNRSAVVELVDDIKAEKSAYKKALETGAGYAVSDKLKTAVSSMTDEIKDLETVEIATAADDMLQSCYLALFEYIGKDIATERTEWVDRNGHKHNGTILQYACYQAGQAVANNMYSCIDLYHDDEDGEEKTIDTLFIEEDFTEEIIGRLSDPSLNDLINAVKSKRRQEVIILINNGYNRVQIADIFGISKQTVKGHIDGITENLRKEYPEYIAEFENRKRLSGYSSHYHKLPENISIFSKKI